MTDKDIEMMLKDSGGLDTSHLKKDDILAKAKQELYFGSATEQTESKKKESFPLRFTKKRFFPALAGAIVMLVLFIGVLGLYNENFQTVYIDINPSVALKINRFERVIGVEYLNDDAKNLLSGTKLVGCDAADALATVISACNTAGYVDADSEIYISASAKEEKSSEKLLSKLKTHAETMREEKDETYAVNTYNAKKNDKKNYEKESLSPAKYNVISEILDEDSGYKLEDLKNKPMDELKKIHRELEERDDRDDDDDRDDREHDDDRDERDDDDELDERPAPPEEEHGNGKPKPENNDRDDDGDDDDDDDDDDGHKQNGKKPEKD